MLPPGLALDNYGDFGFLAIALVETRRLRPAFLPASFGQDFFLCGYRLFTRLGVANSSLRGLYILRSDTDRQLMSSLGNAFTHYRYHVCRAQVEGAGNVIRWQISTPGREADLDVTMIAAGERVSLPESSPFPDWKIARRFAGPLPYTFDYERETGSIVSVKGTRGHWDPQPASVEVRSAGFLAHQRFENAPPLLANAFYVEDVAYHWERGRQVRLR
jgi:hypothetical protein